MKLLKIKNTNVYTYNIIDRYNINNRISTVKIFLFIYNTSSNIPDYWNYIKNKLEDYNIIT